MYPIQPQKRNRRYWFVLQFFKKHTNNILIITRGQNIKKKKTPVATDHACGLLKDHLIKHIDLMQSDCPKQILFLFIALIHLLKIVKRSIYLMNHNNLWRDYFLKQTICIRVQKKTRFHMRLRIDCKHEFVFHMTCLILWFLFPRDVWSGF